MPSAVANAPTQRKSRGDGTPVVLRCMAYKKGKEYRAECIDLDLLVSGRTLAESVSNLNDAIGGYLEVVASSEDIRGLFPRPSPLKSRALYTVMSLWRSILSTGPSNRRGYLVFDELRCFA